MKALNFNTRQKSIRQTVLLGAALVVLTSLAVHLLHLVIYEQRSLDQRGYSRLQAAAHSEREVQKEVDGLLSQLESISVSRDSLELLYLDAVQTNSVRAPKLFRQLKALEAEQEPFLNRLVVLTGSSRNGDIYRRVADAYREKQENVEQLPILIDQFKKILPVLPNCECNALIAQKETEVRNLHEEKLTLTLQLGEIRRVLNNCKDELERNQKNNQVLQSTITSLNGEKRLLQNGKTIGEEELKKKIDTLEANNQLISKQLKNCQNNGRIDSLIIAELDIRIPKWSNNHNLEYQQLKAYIARFVTKGTHGPPK